MALTRAQLLSFYPELESVNQERVSTWMALAEAVLNETEIGPSKYPIMGCSLAAHFLAINPEDGSEGAPGPVLSDKVGEIETRYADVTKGSFRMDPELSTTKYGRQFMFFRRLVFPSRVT